jgi:hypothetical protein
MFRKKKKETSRRYSQVFNSQNVYRYDEQSSYMDSEASFDAGEDNERRHNSSINSKGQGSFSTDYKSGFEFG